MKLSQLVQYKNKLKDVYPKDGQPELHRILGPSLDWAKNTPMQFVNLLNNLESQYNNVQNYWQNYQTTLLHIEKELDQIIESMEHKYLSDSYQIYKGSAWQDSEETMAIRLPINEENEQYLLGRIITYSNWQKSGMIIRPGDEKWVDHLVGCDPLYLVDINHTYFDSVKKKFTPVYQNRLRYYTIKENINIKMLAQLPSNQIGFCLVYNFFHYKPFEIVKSYIKEIYEKLGAGGVLAFTFNDCDRWGAVELCEKNYMCYTPGRMIKGWCESLGFEIINQYILDNATTWLEIRKPGTWNSIKGGQTLARVLAKSK